MKTYNHSRGSIFLLELIINILLFSLLLVVGLKFIIKAHSLTVQTAELHNSVTICTSAATLFENGNGSLDIYDTEFSNPFYQDNTVTIFYDSDYKECQKENALYFLVVRLEANTDNPRLATANISMSSKEHSIYEISAINYLQLTPSDKEVPQNE